MTNHRKFWRPKRSDFVFLLGVGGFISQALNRPADPAIVMASCMFLGFPLVTRADDIRRTEREKEQ